MHGATPRPQIESPANTRLTEDVHRIFKEHKGRASAPRIAKQLRAEGQRVGRNRIVRVMQVERLPLVALQIPR